MRRVALIAVLLAVVGLIVAVSARGGDGGGDYKVRAYFDNGSFMVPGEEVRVAGAKVGTVDSVGVSLPGEVDSLQGGPHAIPGKAVIVLKIDTPGFQDFSSDASCLIRPQSLIGERFVDCDPTQVRAPGTQPPPPLRQIPDGQPGAGEYLLPVENNGETVDLDLVQNINRLPYRERFRLILNDLGAGLAARGKDLGEILDRANPALRATDRVLAILARQNRQLAALASNGDAVLAPLAREREHLTGFLHNAAIVNQATAERAPALEAALSKLPETLHQVRLTMRDLKQFGNQGTPLFADLKAVAPSLNTATKKLGPFASAGIPALKSLGQAATQVGPDLVHADPVITDLRDLGNQAKPSAKALKKVLYTLSHAPGGKTTGLQFLMDAIWGISGSVNGYDSFGHFLRSNLLVTACISYQSVVQPGCIANWGNVAASAASAGAHSARRPSKAGLGVAPTPAAPSTVQQVPELAPSTTTTTPEPPTTPSEPGTTTTTTTTPTPAPSSGSSPAAGAGASATAASAKWAPLDPRMENMALLLDLLLGSGS